MEYINESQGRAVNRKGEKSKLAYIVYYFDNLVK